jgi:hypothetical protein
MQRRALISVAATLAFASASAVAQDGALSGVTMRVLDDLSDVDAVLLELDANRSESAEGAESDGRSERDAVADADSGRDTARAEAEADERRDLRSERDELHEDDDERSEGRREDRDVERPPAAPPAP